MTTVTTKDGVEIFYKDWGPKDAQPIVFHHGWPLSADDWDTQMLFFLGKGYRVIAHDRRGHGRSSQVSDGHDMDHYAADAAAVVEHLDLRNAIHIGHSTGGGEATRYVARHGSQGRVAKLVLIGAVPPIMVKTPPIPAACPIEVFDGLRQQLAANRSQFYLDLPSGPFYGFNRPGAKVSEGVIQNWWRQGMMGGAKAHYDGIKAFSETDFTEDLKIIDVPTLVMHGDDDQIVPIADSALLSAKLLKNGTLKVYRSSRTACARRMPTSSTPISSPSSRPDAPSRCVAAHRAAEPANCALWGNIASWGPEMKVVIIGGTGLIGRKLATKLQAGGHEVVAASPSTGVNSVTGEGLKEVLTGADVVVDVTNAPSFEDNAVLEFFRSSTGHLLSAVAAAGVSHYIALSLVGSDRIRASGYLRAKRVQEGLIEASGVP